MNTLLHAWKRMTDSLAEAIFELRSATRDVWTF